MLYDIDFFPNYKLRDDGTVISFYTNPDGNPLKWCYTKNSCFVKLYNKNGNKMFHKSELQDVVALKQAEAKKPSVFVGIPNTTQYVVNSEDYRVLSFRANKEGKYLKWSESGNQKYVKLIIKNKIVVF